MAYRFAVGRRFTTIKNHNTLKQRSTTAAKQTRFTTIKNHNTLKQNSAIFDSIESFTTIKNHNTLKRRDTWESMA